jgi:hypothetical protein
MSGANSTATTPDPSTLADLAVDGPQARAAGVNGAGIKIGILSDSYHVDGTAGPAATVLEEGPAGSADEGRAMAQLMAVTAPDAQFCFYSAFYSEEDFARGIAALAAAGCQIIVDDVRYPDEPFYQVGGPIDDAVAAAVASGVNYFTAAGNDAANFDEAAWRPGGVVQQLVYVPAGERVTLSLQWDAPYNGASPATLQMSASGGQLVSFQTSGEPDALLSFPVLQTGTLYQVVISQQAGTSAPTLFKDILAGGGIFVSGGAVGSGTLYGQGLVPGVNAVGAINVPNTPYGGGTPQPAWYSSTGPGELLFDANGNRLPSPQALNAVGFLAPDGADTEALGQFYGTSAAAAEAAAVAALVLQADPTLTNADVSAILADSAVPAGATNQAGAGLIRADIAVNYARTHAITASEQPTVTGISRAHTIAGGSGAQVLVAGSGDALILAAGADTVMAGAGADTVDLNGSSALVKGGAGPLTIGDWNGIATIVAGAGLLNMSGGARPHIGGADGKAAGACQLRAEPRQGTKGANHRVVLDPASSGAAAAAARSWSRASFRPRWSRARPATRWSRPATARTRCIPSPTVR